MDATIPDDTDDYLAPDVQGEGSSFWPVFLRAIKVKKDKLAHYNARAMTALLTFAGLFAATVAAFLVDSYKALSPDQNTQAIISTLNQTNILLAQLVSSTQRTPNIVAPPKPFVLDDHAVTYNTLWFLALLLSLVSALLATMVLDWMSDPIAVKRRYAPETLEGYSLRQLAEFMGIHTYGLDRLATLVVGIMHAAVILFIVGLVLWLYQVNTTTARYLAGAAGASAFAYVAASLFPLVDKTCPYRTPLSYLLSLALYGTATFISLVVVYIIMLCRAVGTWIDDKHVFLPDVNPGWLWGLLKEFGLLAPIIPALLYSFIKGDPNEVRANMMDRALRPSHEQHISVNQLLYLTSFTKLHLLETPETLRYMVRRLFSMKSSGISQYIGHLLEDAGMVSRLTAVFSSVGSPTDAVGSIRFLQMLVLADGEGVRPRNDKEAAEREDRRWARLDALISLLPPFFVRYGELSASATDQGDVSLLAAVSGLRWALIIAMGKMSGYPHPDESPGHFAQSRLQWLFKLLQSIAALRMPVVSANDHEDLSTLFDSQGDPRVELAYRNAFTLLDGASRCGWRDGWQETDPTYLPKNTPHMWEWRRALDVATPTHKPAAMKPLRDLLNQELVKASLGTGPGLAALGGASLDALAIGALADLKSIVDVGAPLPLSPTPAPAPSSAPVSTSALPPGNAGTPDHEPASEPAPELSPAPELLPAPELSFMSEPATEAENQGSPVGETASEVCFCNSNGVSSQHSDSSSSDGARDEAGPLLSNAASREKEWERRGSAQTRVQASE
ncbi:unnamed protein product [Peniophora sp. CBMAI 1063]|nr:unnamed protein product [Peniophora sp. CBMAI 1063]